MRLVGVGACYMDTILSVPYYPAEDEKLRATNIHRRRGGNVPNTLEVLQQLVSASSGSEHKPQLYLCSVMPALSSVGSSEIKASFGPSVDLSHCLYRDAHSEPASSYIIKSSSADSRTIVNYNDLPEMTCAEFIAMSDSFDDEATWYHFEGRIPDVTLQFMRHLRQNHPTVRLSVEVEKPGRPGLESLAAQADVVFYSKSWSRERGYPDAIACVRDQARIARKASHLFCTWGEAGATAFDVKHQEIYNQRAASIAAVTDTIGAGDTFIAGVLYGMLWRDHDWDVSRVLEFASTLAGCKIAQEGFQGLGDRMRISGAIPA
ncbi:hypothetical protein PV08_10381 [Exophiala spinifera]|uniref:Carbohydrate kinase PfkB domain-containing protein n=1 Tax=Exophiala spinifera TaxID=91928 RepID=A0A0D1ZDM2_9EURO|nr:uncharacterized protein PV08_10381 [Exophiala spinifera]KIW11082.1 hypothetical protein PV08_10381 [Exophiala spinifera]